MTFVACWMVGCSSAVSYCRSPYPHLSRTSCFTVRFNGTYFFLILTHAWSIHFPAFRLRWSCLLAYFRRSCPYCSFPRRFLQSPAFVKVRSNFDASLYTTSRCTVLTTRRGVHQCTETYAA